MKRIIKLLLLMFCLIFITGCNNKYSINEKATLDNIDITLKKATLFESDTLELSFEINNNQKSSITISPEKNFKFYGINKVLIPNIYSNDNNIIKSNETINYTLLYNIGDKEIYDILFYSGRGNNNIKFSLTKLDLE